MARTIIVGDVHGCLAELDALLEYVGFSRGDRLVSVGDLVVRGPDPTGVLDRLRELERRPREPRARGERRIRTDLAEERLGRADRRGDLAELRRLMERTLPMVGPGGLAAGFFETNQAFHDFQIGLAGNWLLRESYRRLSVNALMARVLSGDLDLGSDVAAEHVELVEAFEGGDLDRVGAAIRLHVETGKRLAREAIERAGGVL
jgi:hypothetical protein